MEFSICLSIAKKVNNNLWFNGGIVNGWNSVDLMLSQLTFTCSKSTSETVDKCVKYNQS